MVDGSAQPRSLWRLAVGGWPSEAALKAAAVTSCGRIPDARRSLMPVAPSDLVAPLYHALGVPEHQTLTDIGGRPHFVRPGKMLAELFA